MFFFFCILNAKLFHFSKKILKTYFTKIRTLVKPTAICTPLFVCTSPPNLVKIGQYMAIFEAVMDGRSKGSHRISAKMVAFSAYDSIQPVDE